MTELDVLVDVACADLARSIGSWPARKEITDDQVGYAALVIGDLLLKISSLEPAPPETTPRLTFRRNFLKVTSACGLPPNEVWPELRICEKSLLRQDGADREAFLQAGLVAALSEIEKMTESSDKSGHGKLLRVVAAMAAAVAAAATHAVIDLTLAGSLAQPFMAQLDDLLDKGLDSLTQQVSRRIDPLGLG